MKAVCDLFRLGSAFPCSSSILPSSISADQFDFGMSTQPGFQCFLSTIWYYEGYPLVALKNFSGIERKTLIIVS